MQTRLDMLPEAESAHRTVGKPLVIVSFLFVVVVVVCCFCLLLVVPFCFQQCLIDGRLLPIICCTIIQSLVSALIHSCCSPADNTV